MALPGTQMFESLDDSGKIRIDRRYFRHILSSTSLWATSTYSGLSRTKLTYWKFRLMRHFYSRQRKLVGSEGMLSTVRQAVAALRQGDGADTTKLHSAFRNGIISAGDTVKVKVKPGGWMDRRRERALFESWDGIYREIRARNQACGAALQLSTDPSRLHEVNVTKQIKQAHGTKRRIPVSVASS